MSTLRVDNLLNSAGNESPISVPGTAKAWIVLNGGSANIGTGSSSYNISGVTDHGTGDYEIAFSNAFPNTNYGYVITGNHTIAGGQGFSYGYQSHVDNSRHTATSFRFWIGWLGHQVNPTRQDLNPLTVVFYGP